MGNWPSVYRKRSSIQNMTRGQDNIYCPMSSSVPDSRIESHTEVVFNGDVRISEVENKYLYL